MIHQLKIRKAYFADIAFGRKTYEIRRDDRDYRIGDYLGLNEINEIAVEGERRETGRFILARIVGIMRESEFVVSGYVILSIKACAIIETEPNGAKVYDR